MEPHGDVVACKRGHPKPYRGECRTCKKARDDQHRLAARLAGKDAERQRDWFRQRYWSDPKWRRAQLDRNREYKSRPEVRLGYHAGVSTAAARAILEAVA